MDYCPSAYNSYFYINPNYNPYSLPINQTHFYPNSDYTTNTPLNYIAYYPPLHNSSSDFIHRVQNYHQQEFSFLEEETIIIDGTQDDDVIHRVQNYNLDSLVLDQQETSFLGEETTIFDEESEPSFEDYLLFEQVMARVDSGLSVETITQHVKNRNYVAAAAAATINEEEGGDICVICQSEYENNELLGGLQCGHEYHKECVLRWLQHKNNCPVCKATAVS